MRLRLGGWPRAIGMEGFPDDLALRAILALHAVGAMRSRRRGTGSRPAHSSISATIARPIASPTFMKVSAFWP